MFKSKIIKSKSSNNNNNNNNNELFYKRNSKTKTFNKIDYKSQDNNLLNKNNSIMLSNENKENLSNIIVKKSNILYISETDLLNSSDLSCNCNSVKSNNILVRKDKKNKLLLNFENKIPQDTLKIKNFNKNISPILKSKDLYNSPEKLDISNISNNIINSSKQIDILIPANISFTDKKYSSIKLVNKYSDISSIENDFNKINNKLSKEDLRNNFFINKNLKSNEKTNFNNNDEVVSFLNYKVKLLEEVNDESFCEGFFISGLKSNEYTYENNNEISNTYENFKLLNKTGHKEINNIEFNISYEEKSAFCGHKDCSILYSYKPQIIASIQKQKPSHYNNKINSSSNLEINNLIANLCFPTGIKLCFGEMENNLKLNNNFLTFITNDKGDRYYLMVYNFYIKYTSEDFEKKYKLVSLKEYFKNLQELQLNLEKAVNMNEKKLKDNINKCSKLLENKNIYVPQCACLISKYPYASIMEQCLDSYFKLASDKRFNVKEIINYIKYIVFEIPIPVIDTRILFYIPYYCNSISIPSVYYNYNSLNSNYDDKNLLEQKHYLKLLNFNLVNFLIIFPSELILMTIHLILLEQRILFLSDKNNMLSYVIDLFLTLIYPLSWTGTCIPILSDELIEYVQSFMPYIMGINSTQINKIKDLIEDSEDVFLFDIKSKNLRLINNQYKIINKISLNKIITPFPEELEIYFIKELKKVKNIISQIILINNKEKNNKVILDTFEFLNNKNVKLLEIENNSNLFNCSFYKIGNDSNKIAKNGIHLSLIEKDIRDLFILLVIQLIGDYRNYLIFVDNNLIFNTKEFLNLRNKNYMTFYNELISTQNFMQFIQNHENFCNKYFNIMISKYSYLINNPKKISEYTTNNLYCLNINNNNKFNRSKLRRNSTKNKDIICIKENLNLFNNRSFSVKYFKKNQEINKENTNKNKNNISKEFNINTCINQKFCAEKDKCNIERNEFNFSNSSTLSYNKYKFNYKKSYIIPPYIFGQTLNYFEFLKIEELLIDYYKDIKKVANVENETSNITSNINYKENDIVFFLCQIKSYFTNKKYNPLNSSGNDFYVKNNSLISLNSSNANSSYNSPIKETNLKKFDLKYCKRYYIKNNLFDENKIELEKTSSHFNTVKNASTKSSNNSSFNKQLNHYIYKSFTNFNEDFSINYNKNYFLKLYKIINFDITDKYTNNSLNKENIYDTIKNILLSEKVNKELVNTCIEYIEDNNIKYFITKLIYQIKFSNLIIHIVNSICLSELCRLITAMLYASSSNVDEYEILYMVTKCMFLYCKHENKKYYFLNELFFKRRSYCETWLSCSFWVNWYYLEVAFYNIYKYCNYLKSSYNILIEMSVYMKELGIDLNTIINYLLNNIANNILKLKVKILLILIYIIMI